MPKYRIIEYCVDRDTMADLCEGDIVNWDEERGLAAIKNGLAETYDGPEEAGPSPFTKSAAAKDEAASDGAVSVKEE